LVRAPGLGRRVSSRSEAVTVLAPEERPMRHPPGARARGRRVSPGLMALVFCAPALVLYTVFMVWPLAQSMRFAFLDRAGDWVGLDNLDRLFTDSLWSERFWRALRQNMVFFLYHCLVQNPVGLGLAALLTVARLRGADIYRTLIFIPTTLSVVVVGFAWGRILNPLWGIVETPLLGRESTALPTLSLISVWQWVGIPMMFFYATLIAIPQDLVDASRVDGASAWATFWRVCFPLVLPMFGVITIVTYIANMNAFDLVFTVKGVEAGPARSTDLLGTLFYRTRFGSTQGVPDRAMGATVASATFLVILVGLLAFFLVWRRRVRTYEL
jgi:raffinose/stachyose/melibiose transport system permease protein